MNMTTSIRARGTTFLRVLVVLVLVGGIVWWLGRRPAGPAGDPFVRAMNTGKNYLDAGESTNAIVAFRQAVGLKPTEADAHLNLANALLRAGMAGEALGSAERALELDPKLLAAHYVAGCARLRLRQFESALQALQTVHDADMSVAAVSFQLAKAHQELGHLEEAAAAFQETITLQADHPVAHYALSQVLIRLGRTDEAAQSIETHRQVLAARKAPTDVALLERCRYTEARVPFVAEVPDARGIAVRFVDVTAAVLGEGAAYQGPAGIIDLFRDGRPCLFVADASGSLRLLTNGGGGFRAMGEPIAGGGAGRFARCLVADLNHDKVEDVLMLGPQGSRVFRLATNGLVRDVTRATGLTNLLATDGALVDLDFTGKLDLVAVGAGTGGVRVFRNLGNWYFTDRTATSGIPATLTGVRQVVVDDWNSDDLADAWLVGGGRPPGFFMKQRGGALVATNVPPEWPAADALAVGDVNNDLHPDLVLAGGGRLTLVAKGMSKPVGVASDVAETAGVALVDYDNDGWLDVLAWGKGLRVWRNAGPAGFQETTAALGFDRLAGTGVESLAWADLDEDGDVDLVVTLAGGGLTVWRNEGGHVHGLLKLRLAGNRSNASGIGMQIELASGGWRTRRTVRTLPVEIGVGSHTNLESMTIRWFDLAQNIVDVKADPKLVLTVDEWQLPTGSCPFLYAWDGQGFRFVTDILGAAPVGLRMSDDRFIPADTDELVWVGTESMFPPREGRRVVQITSELREVLYLDEAQLVVVDHPPGTEVHPLDKLVPGPPFPPTGVWVLRDAKPLRSAWSSEGEDVTARLLATDGQWVSPARLRPPQLRGLAEPHGVVLDFGVLDVGRPLVLALTGWLRFGGGMANVGASHHPDLPFPFPTLEVETAEGVWQRVEVVVGAPCGKTKTMLVDLAGRLPAGARRLRLTTAFEIHWDRAALWERGDDDLARVAWVKPESADLHWRGYSPYEERPWFEPLTPDYARVRATPAWWMAVTGWCTRYGRVDELVAARDEAFVLVNGGDELTLTFSVAAEPSRAEGMERQYFLFTDGWEKDGDFHVELGYQVGPLPWHGMDDQLYGRQPRPAFPNDGWTNRYNTRWVGPLTYR